jgi:hypothetical protein
MTMSRHLHAMGRGALMALVLVGLSQAPTTPAQPAAPPAPPTFETMKVEGTDHVYMFLWFPKLNSSEKTWPSTPVSRLADSWEAQTG